MKRFLLSALVGFTITADALAGGVLTWPTPPLPPDANPAAIPVGPCVGWLNHFQQVLEASRKIGKVDLIFDGDTYSINGNPKGDHGGIWGPRYANLNAFDFANPGDATQNVLWRLQNGQVDKLHPKLIVLLIGGSNLQSNTPEQVAEGIKAIIQEYQKRCPEATILLQGIFPRRELPSDAMRLKIKETNKIISAFVDGGKVIFLDFGDKFLKPDGVMTKEILCDFMFPRPSAQAYKIWADSIQSVIDQFFPAASSSVVSASTPVAVQPHPITSVAIVGGTVTWPQPPLPPGGNSAVIPVPPMGRLNGFQQAIDDARKMPQVDLVFDGDSITAGWKAGGSPIWSHNYRKRNAVDFGVSGDSTQGLLWRVENGQVDGLHPKVVILLIGTNNTGGCTAEQIAGGIKADVEAYRKHCPDATIILMGIFPRGEKATDPVRAKIKAVNKIISALADGKKVIFVDIGEKLLEPDGTLSREIMPDLLHPSAKGYQIWVDAIQPIIDQFVPPISTPTASAIAPVPPSPKS